MKYYVFVGVWAIDAAKRVLEQRGDREYVLTFCPRIHPGGFYTAQLPDDFGELPEEERAKRFTNLLIEAETASAEGEY